MAAGGPSFKNAAPMSLCAKLLASALFVAVCAAIIAIEFACSPVSQGTPTPEATPTPIVIVEPTMTDEGLIYFEASDKVYWDSLTAFYRKNPTLHCDYQGATTKAVVDGWSDGRFAYTVITGHILHCHDIAVEAQDLTKE